VLGCYVSVKAVKRHKKESVFLLAGMLILTLGALLDSMVYMGVLTARYMLSTALFGFIIIQIIMLSKRYSEAFRHVELLSAELQLSLDMIMNTNAIYHRRSGFSLKRCPIVNFERTPMKPQLIESLSKYLSRPWI
jgi:hypothetical protein